MHHHNIVESIGPWGVRTSRYQTRMTQVRPGDIVEVPEELRRYPCEHQFSRIENVIDGQAIVCEDMGSAFLCEDGRCSISGGPWWSVPVATLKPKYELREATYWNWGDNGPGANHGVYYQIYRPVHVLSVHPNDIERESR